MKQFNIIFPELSFTTCGVYSYTIKEMPSSDEDWQADGRIYRVVITVSKSEDGSLIAKTEYPDGLPSFVSIYCPPTPRPQKDVCKIFNKLPFPLLWFFPPEKADFDELIRKTPSVFDWCKTLEKYFK